MVSTRSMTDLYVGRQDRDRLMISFYMLKCQCKKTCQFKTWCKGDKAIIENGTDHFCEDTRQNALAALTNLGHMTPFLMLGPFII